VVAGTRERGAIAGDEMVALHPDGQAPSELALTSNEPKLFVSTFSTGTIHLSPYPLLNPNGSPNVLHEKLEVTQPRLWVRQVKFFRLGEGRIRHENSFRSSSTACRMQRWRSASGASGAAGLARVARYA
jgi:hypothetical protein